MIGCDRLQVMVAGQSTLTGEVAALSATQAKLPET